MKAPDLPGYDRFGFSAVIGESDTTFLRPVYTKGAGGPAVILVHEMLGMGPETLELADELVGAGYRVFLPLLFGRPGVSSRVNIARAICLRRLFDMFERGSTAPLVEWLRHLADDIAGSGDIGIVGQCLTGSLVIATVHHPRVRAVVAAQPAVPIGIGAKRRAAAVPSAGIADDDLASAAQSGDGLLAIRYTNDRMCPRDRFETLATAFGGSLAPEPDTGVSHQRVGSLEVMELAGDGHASLTNDRHEAAVDAVKDFLARRLPIEPA